MAQLALSPLNGLWGASKWIAISGVIQLRFLNQTPEQGFMKQLLDGLGHPFSGDRYSSDCSLRFNTRHRVVCEDMHRLVQELLLPLHQRYPLQAANFFVEPN
jgi:hypothetical protein